jgi:hypothetical protein
MTYKTRLKHVQWRQMAWASRFVNIPEDTNGHAGLFIYHNHRGETYRVVTSVPTFFVRVLSNLLDVYASDWMTTHFKLAEHAQLIVFARSPEKKWVHKNVSFRSVYDGQLQLCMSLLCGITFCFRDSCLRDFAWISIPSHFKSLAPWQTFMKWYKSSYCYIQ